MTAALATRPAVTPPAADGADDVVNVDELAYTPTDIEEQALSALLYSAAGIARTVVENLAAADFYDPSYAQLFEVVAGLVREGRPHGPQFVQVEMQRVGTFRPLVNKALLDVTVFGGVGVDAGHYARAVMAQAYRRGYAVAAERLAQLAAEASEDDLFEQMCVLGRERREAKQRLAAATAALM